MLHRVQESMNVLIYMVGICLCAKGLVIMKVSGLGSSQKKRERKTGLRDSKVRIGNSGLAGYSICPQFPVLQKWGPGEGQHQNL